MYFDVKITEPAAAAYPFRCFAELRVSLLSKAADGEVTLGPQLMTPQEIDTLVARLKAELEVFGREAKSALQSRASRT